MRFILTITLALVAAWPAAAAEISDAARETASSIDGRRIAGRVRFLASPFMEGREAGTHGERLAAEYLRDFYIGLGLTPAGDEGSYYQFFDLHEKTLGEGNAFHVIREGAGRSAMTTRFELDDDFLPFVFSPSADVEAPVVFAGYGIRAPEYGYDDYKGLDVAGKIVLLLRHEPQEGDLDAKFKGLKTTKHAAFLSKVRLAQELGAVGVLIVTDPVNHDADRRDPGNSLARWASLIERGDYDRRGAPDPYQFYPEIAADVTIPALHVSFAAASALWGNGAEDLEAVQRKIDEKLQPASSELSGVRAAIKTRIETKAISVRNVAAKIEGSDPALEDEVVFIGGHYDHVGYGHFGSASGSWDQMHPGADDNASGTASIMSIAEAFALAETGPKRTIVFLHFTAEEKGLMGSRWYVEHPTVDLDKAVAMLNLDMVGRNEPTVVSVVGDAGAEGLNAWVKAAGTDELGLSVNNDAGSGIDRSDQWAFALKEIPSIAFFSGVHDDYHRPGDTASKVIPEKMQNIARLAAMTLWEAAEHGRALFDGGQ